MQPALGDIRDAPLPPTTGPGPRAGRLARWAWAPFPLLLLAVAGLWIAGLAGAGPGGALRWVGWAALALGTCAAVLSALAQARSRPRGALEVPQAGAAQRLPGPGALDRSLVRDVDRLLISAPVGVAKIVDRRPVWVNRKMEEMFGWRREELVGQPAEMLFPDADRCAQLFRDAGGALREGRPFRAEHEAVRKDGSRLWIRCHAMEIEGRDPSRELLWVAEDVTEQRLAGERLAENEARLRSMFGTMAEGVVLQDAEGRVVSCNAAAERILGVPHQSMLGRSTIDPRWRMIHEDGSPLGAEVHPAMIALRTGLRQRGVVMGVQAPGAELRWISVSSEPLRASPEGALGGVVSTFTDITELRRGREALRESERRLAAVLDGSDDGYFELLPATREAMHSPRMAAIIGEGEGFTLTLDAWEQRIHPEDRERVAAAMGALADGAAPRADVQYRVQPRHGDWRWVRVRAKAAREGPKGPVRIAGTARDITAPRQAQERLERALAENEKLVAELRDALARVKTLTGLLPICSYCKKIRSDEGYWERIESYVSSRTDAEFSHGMCPACIEKHFGAEE